MSNRWRVYVYVLLTVLMVTVVFLMMRATTSAASDAEKAKDKASGVATTNAEVAEEYKRGMESLVDQLKDLGKTPRVEPSDLPTIPPANDGVSESDVRLIAQQVINAAPFLTSAEVTSLIADHLRRNPPKDGVDGHTPTRAEIRAVVSEELAANPPPPGPSGQPGNDGQPGQDGRGVASTTITDGHLLITYSDGEVVDLGQVVGADGAPGKDGTDGTDGRGITSIDCNLVVGSIAITYSDGEVVVLECKPGP